MMKRNNYLFHILLKDLLIIIILLLILKRKLKEKKNINGHELLLDEIKNLPERIIKLDVDFQRLINLNQLNDIKLNQLIDLYNYIEDISYDKIIKNVSKEAYNSLDKKQIELLNNHFNQENILISKKDLCKAVQKFISRYLISDQFKHYNWNIFDILNREGKPELWDKDLIYSDENQRKFDAEIEIIYSINIKIGQSIDFSKYLGFKKEKELKKLSKE
eukprot:jgi/Orpsp1_1/1175915/evm.model.c7180000055706.2